MIKRGLFILLFGATVVAGQDRLSGRDVAPANRLLLTGSFHGDEINARSGDQYLGFYRESGRDRLELSRITVVREVDAVVDEVEGQMTGKRVEVSGSGEPVFLIARASGLTPGPVETVFHGKEELVTGPPKTIKLGLRTYSLSVRSRRLRSEPGIASDDSKLVLSVDGRSQTLYSLGGPGDPTEAYWSLLWAGDLDRDGQLDLFVKVASHYNEALYRLYISSRRAPKEIVHLIGELRSVGC
jgi:hypothetical protein